MDKIDVKNDFIKLWNLFSDVAKDIDMNSYLSMRADLLEQICKKGEPFFYQHVTKKPQPHAWYLYVAVKDGFTMKKKYLVYTKSNEVAAIYLLGQFINRDFYFKHIEINSSNATNPFAEWFLNLIRPYSDCFKNDENACF